MSPKRKPRRMVSAKRRPNKQQKSNPIGDITRAIADVERVVETFLPLLGNQKSSAAPVARSVQKRFKAPRLKADAAGQVVTHRELIATVVASDNAASPADPFGDNLKKYSLQPGDPTTFPWLAENAKNWSQYHFRNLTAIYHARCATTTSGSVLMAPDYTASDPAPTTEAQMTAYKGAVENVPWQDISLPISVNDMHSMSHRKFIRNASVAGDIKTFDAGNLYVAAFGQPAAISGEPIGKLWIEYTVEFHVPQIMSTTIPSSPTFSVFYNSTAQAISDTTNTIIAFDTAITNGLNATAHPTVSGRWILPRGLYKITCMLTAQCTGTLNSAQLELYQDGVSLTPYCWTYLGSHAADYFTMPALVGVVSSDGTQDVGIDFLADVSASNTLLDPEDCRLIIESM